MNRRTPTIFVISTLLGGSLALVPAPASAARTCFGKPATIVGKNLDPGKPMELNGTRGNDVIVGLKGWDLIDARGGRDLICGGNGDDYIEAGPGDDKVKGQGSLDTLLGQGGNDLLLGGRGADSLSGGVGTDRLFGGRGGEDSLVGGAGNDRMDGGEGYDWAEFWDSPRGVTADLRTDRASGFGDDVIVDIEGLVGSTLNDVLNGDEHSNILRGGSGDDELHAFGSTIDGGADVLRSDGGNDVLDGGDGADIVSYNLQPLPVEASLATGEATSADGFGHDTFVDIEHLTGSKYDDVLTGDGGDNSIIGNGGDDVLDGGGGSDEASYVDSRIEVAVDLQAGIATAVGWGNDTLKGFENLSGSFWDDTLLGDDTPNLIWGGSGADSLGGRAGNDVLLGYRGVDSGDGGEGTADECDTETQIACEVDLTQPAAKTSETPVPIWARMLWSEL